MSQPLDLERLTRSSSESCDGLADVDAERILKATLKDLYDGVPMDEVRKCVVLAARTLIEKDPAYSFVTARLLLDAIRHEALGEEATQADMATQLRRVLPALRQARRQDRPPQRGAAAVRHEEARRGARSPSATCKFGYLGLQTLYDRYFLVDQYASHATPAAASSCRSASSCASRWASR